MVPAAQAGHAALSVAGPVGRCHAARRQARSSGASCARGDAQIGCLKVRLGGAAPRQPDSALGGKRGQASRPRAIASRVVVSALAADPGAAALEKGKTLYAQGERMDALKTFEAALNGEADLTTETRMELLYSAACCHAAFGDIDSAWQNLRDSMLYGLDYANIDQYPNFMRMEVSPQMRKQLSKYAAGQIKSSGTIAREKFDENRAVREPWARPADAQDTGFCSALPAGGGEKGGEESAHHAPRDPSAQAAPQPSRPVSKTMPVLKDLDLDASTSDDFGAIARRVLLLLVVAAVAGVVLFNAGLATFKGT